MIDLTEREKSLFLRSMDKASAPAETAKAAEALILSLRKRGISAYDVLASLAHRSRPQPTPPPQPAYRPPDARRASPERQHHIFNPHPDSVLGRLFKQNAPKPGSPQPDWSAWSAWADAVSKF